VSVTFEKGLRVIPSGLYFGTADIVVVAWLLSVACEKNAKG
jgi:hypothetical protein